MNKLVSDHDATTRRNLSTNNNDELPIEFKTPEFLADLNHRVKVIAKPLFELARLSKTLSTYNKDSALLVKRNFSWYSKSSVRDENVSFDDFYKTEKIRSTTTSTYMNDAPTKSAGHLN